MHLNKTINFTKRTAVKFSNILAVKLFSILACTGGMDGAFATASTQSETQSNVVRITAENINQYAKIKNYGSATFIAVLTDKDKSMSGYLLTKDFFKPANIVELELRVYRPDFKIELEPGFKSPSSMLITSTIYDAINKDWKKLGDPNIKSIEFTIDEIAKRKEGSLTKDGTLTLPNEDFDDVWDVIINAKAFKKRLKKIIVRDNIIINKLMLANFHFRNLSIILPTNVTAKIDLYIYNYMKNKIKQLHIENEKALTLESLNHILVECILDNDTIKRTVKELWNRQFTSPESAKFIIYQFGLICTMNDRRPQLKVELMKYLVEHDCLYVFDKRELKKLLRKKYFPLAQKRKMKIAFNKLKKKA